MGLMFSQDAVRHYNQSEVPGAVGPAPLASGAAATAPAAYSTLAPSAVAAGEPSDTGAKDQLPGGRGIAAKAASTAASAAGVYLRFHVTGIKCEGCAARLKAAMLRLPGVSRCVVDFPSGSVLLWGEPGAQQRQQQLTAAAVRSAIQFVDLSYRVTLVEEGSGAAGGAGAGEV
ncbi:hypothetical protein GPECTOR_57g511 [Gonium pectorale]|uniref:HMA domain-containing protein n=1 Tax=Gonium pectorale TaxID=33097 RepID=A0A150G5W6_GONPE|nr:hypothetical protein GPECTOR_57g511 [Gonium pectorale]|eukprot:KXZ45221.1 hypothetical protein GPECTOR_57g511 [Gonium pectorale]